MNFENFINNYHNILSDEELLFVVSSYLNQKNIRKENYEVSPEFIKENFDDFQYMYEKEALNKTLCSVREESEFERINLATNYTSTPIASPFYQTQPLEMSSCSSIANESISQNLEYFIDDTDENVWGEELDNESPDFQDAKMINGIIHTDCFSESCDTCGINPYLCSWNQENKIDEEKIKQIERDKDFHPYFRIETSLSDQSINDLSLSDCTANIDSSKSEPESPSKREIFRHIEFKNNRLDWEGLLDLRKLKYHHLNGHIVLDICPICWSKHEAIIIREPDSYEFFFCGYHNHFGPRVLDFYSFKNQFTRFGLKYYRHIKVLKPQPIPNHLKLFVLKINDHFKMVHMAQEMVKVDYDFEPACKISCGNDYHDYKENYYLSSCISIGCMLEMDTFCHEYVEMKPFQRPMIINQIRHELGPIESNRILTSESIISDKIKLRYFCKAFFELYDDYYGLYCSCTPLTRKMIVDHMINYSIKEMVDTSVIFKFYKRKEISHYKKIKHGQ